MSYFMQYKSSDGLILKKASGRIHFIGVGGVGMVSLFSLCEHLGVEVSGSDIKENEYTAALKREGKRISVGCDGENVKGAAAVAYTSAVQQDNAELEYARAHGIPAFSRAELLGVLMQLYGTRIGVSGTHGKSTTVAMLAEIYKRAGRAPTVLCGAALASGMPYIITDSEELIYEACEYKDAFLCFSPTAAVFTNLEHDHVDYFKDIHALKDSFLAAMNIPNYAVVNCDDERLCSLLPEIQKPTVTYGEGARAEYRIVDVRSENGFYSFKILHGGRYSPEISLSVAGKFNVMNAAGALALAASEGIDISVCADALSSYKGISRRLEYLGKVRGTAVYYDYAHHPTEIRKTVSAVREIHKAGIGVIFRPHTYSRTEGLLSDFISSLSEADRVWLLDISAIREPHSSSISSEALADFIGEQAACIKAHEVADIVKNSDMGTVIIMGAADIDIRELKELCK